jgi:type IX secretion system PorP/SprF family membrane protein
MENQWSLIFVLVLFTSGTVFCQEANYGPGYQTIIIDNPAVAGSRLEGTLRLSYLNFYPGHHYNFHSVFLSCDSYFPVLHGGAGFYITDDYTGGIMNDLRSGLSYSYFLQAGKKLFINAGLSASLFHRGFNFTDAILPDQIDAMGGISIPSSEILMNANRTVLDVGTGFIAIYGRFIGGFAVNHLAQPDLAGNGSSSNKLRRKYLLNFTADFDLSSNINLKIRPLVTLMLQGDYFSGYAGALLETNSLTINSGLVVSNNKNIDIQAGFSFRKERLAIFYGYRFNISSENSLMPFSLIHQTGLALGLNNVKKRIKVRTINMPEL